MSVSRSWLPTPTCCRRARLRSDTVTGPHEAEPGYDGLTGVETIRAHWTDAADACRLTTAEREGFWERLILNLDIFES